MQLQDLFELYFFFLVFLNLYLTLYDWNKLAVVEIVF